MMIHRIPLLIFFVLLAAFSLQPAPAQQHEQTPGSKSQAPNPQNRLRIEVTGGEADKPVENASVYLKTLKEGLIKDKKFEVNVKTNQLGVAHVPDAPMGRVLIQIVAEGWKPYGHWYDITEQKQTIKIHLDRPPKWY
jgi:hypothetical protein